MIKRVFSVLIVALAALSYAEKTTTLRLATTTSTENSGLLAAILPEFTRESGFTVHVIAVGSGKAIMLGKNGDVDLILVHSRKAEDEFIASVFGINRRDVMYNDFIIAGPAEDPASVASAGSSREAFGNIAAAKAPFISRGDESGTHAKEKSLWEAAAVTPAGAWYIQAGQGMEAVLIMANEKNGYTLADRGTFIAVEDKIQLKILYEGDTNLFNQYGIIAVNPAKHPHVKYDEAMKFINWITGVNCQKLIAGFSKNGKQLFFPDAGQEKR